VDERIDPGCNVIAGEHHLTIQLLRDIHSCAERGIVFIWPPTPTLIQPVQLVTVSNAIVATWLRRGSSSQRSELANGEQRSSMPRSGMNLVVHLARPATSALASDKTWKTRSHQLAARPASPWYILRAMTPALTSSFH
jgi:hypothetical protein